MNSFFTKEDGEIHYYSLRDKAGTDAIFISKLIEFPNSITGNSSKRYIRKVYGGNEETEVVKVKGEYLLRSSPQGRSQVKVIVYENDSGKIGFVLQKFRGKHANPITESNFSFYEDEFKELLEFLKLVGFIDFSNLAGFKLSLSELKERVLVSQKDKEFIDNFKNLQGEYRLNFLERIRKQNLTKEDLDILSGRKAGLEKFYIKLFVDKDWTEPKWQEFFKKNTWIFGLGLDYRFQSILQPEAHISDSDLDGKNTIKADFLTGGTDFTVIVELKRPDTKLFENIQNRSRAWKMSNDLFDSVSQILSQKVYWEKKSIQNNYGQNGQLIKQKTLDPKCILIIGNKEQFSGDDKEKDMKLRTFEMFRRDSRNIEILTYDELYNRAYFIVNQKLPQQ